MAKKKAVKKKSSSRAGTAKPDSNEHDSIDERPEVRSAAEALRAAQAELQKAQEQYQQLREQAAETIENVRDTTLGDVVDGALEIVRKHPAASLLAAAACGFMFDRWLRK